MKKLLLILTSGLGLLPSASATPVYFPVLEMTGSTNDVTINVRAVNNPIIYNGSFYTLPRLGTNLTTSGGVVTNEFIPGAYFVSVSGLPKTWTIYVTNTSTAISAVAFSREIVRYSGVQSIAGDDVTDDGLGNYTIASSGSSAFAAADTVVSNGLSARLLATNTALVDRITAATNGITSGTSGALTNNDTRTVTLTNVAFGNTNGSQVLLTNAVQYVINPSGGTGLAASRLGSGYLWATTAGDAIMAIATGSVSIYTNAVFGSTINGNGYGITNIPLAGVTGLTNALNFFTNNLGGGGTITAASLSSGTNSFAGNGAGLTNLSVGVQTNTHWAATTNLIDRLTTFAATNGLTRYNVKAYGAVGNGSTDDTAAIQTVATLATATSAATVGQILFPQGTYKISNEIFVNGSPSNPGIINANFTAGYWSMVGNKNSIITNTANTNTIKAINGMRMGLIKDLALIGTNLNGASSVGNQTGIALDGANGHLTIDDVVVQQFIAGLVIDDITDLDVRNMTFMSNFVGTAIGYKPDNVRIYGRWQGCTYGVMNGWTNTQYTLRADAGQPTIEGTFGACSVGVLIQGGAAVIGPTYFENCTASIQLGLNSSNAYQATYSAYSSIPNVVVQNWDGNSGQDITVYTRSVLRLKDSPTFGTAGGGLGRIRLMNTSANDSTIISDTPVIIVNSSSSSFSIGNGYMFVSNAIVPLSGMSYTNLTDIPAAGNGYWISNVTDSVLYSTEIGSTFDAYWPLNESSGTRLSYVGNDHLYATGAVAAIAGRVSGAVTNYGSSVYLNALDSDNLSYRGAGGFSFGGWFQATGDATTDVFLMEKSGEYSIYYDGSAANRIRASFGNANLLLNESWTATSPSGVTTNKLITVKWDGSTLTGQIMGGSTWTTNLNTAGGAITPPSNTSSSLRVGYGVHATTVAVVDELWLMHHAMTAAERTAIYNSGNGRAYLATNDVSVLNLQVKGSITGGNLFGLTNTQSAAKIPLATSASTAAWSSDITIGTIQASTLTLSNLFTMKTNYLVADWVPVVGQIKFAASNNAIYSISTTKTNLIVAP